MIAPTATAMRVRTTSYASPPTPKPRRSSSSEGLQRRVLDLYAKQRRMPTAALLRLPLCVAALLLLAAAATLSWTAGRNGVARGLRVVAGAAGKMAEVVDGGVLLREVEEDELVHEETVVSETSETVEQEDPVAVHVPPGAVRVPPGAVRVPPGAGRVPPGAVRVGEDVTGSRRAGTSEVVRPLTVFADLNYVTPRSVPGGHISLNSALETPNECSKWRSIARNTSEVHPYREHFTSLDVIDWFLYVAVFDERFHANAAGRHRRPRYLDVAANHARRWSASWFYDRCMGWDGVCAEANPKYLPELAAERHCHLIPTCVSDVPRTVKFSMTDAYGGVVKDDTQRFGVDGEKHSKAEKFKSEFGGFRELKCTTLKTELARLEMQRFDFMSLDVEGHELPILQGIDWPSTIIDVIVTENRTPQVQSLLENVGYTLYKNVLKDYIYIRNDSGIVIKDEWIRMVRRLDRKTYYFIPE